MRNATAGRLGLAAGVLMAFGAAAGQAQAAVTFEADGTFAIGTGPSDLLAVELDRLFGSDPELVVANAAADTVSVLKGNGDGTFGARVTYPVGRTPHGLAAGDLNPDFEQDVVTANFSDNTVSVLQGHHSGVLSRRRDYAVGTNPEAVAIGDFDGDGARDLAVSNAGDDTISILVGHPTFDGQVHDVTFTPGPLLQTGDRPQEVATGDFDGDGRADLAVTNDGSHSVSVFLALPGGGFAPKADHPTASNQPWRLVVADVNADADPDLVATDNGGVTVLVGQPGGGFAPQPQLTTPGPVAADVVAADFTGDHDPELVAAHVFDPILSAFRGGAGATFPDRTDSPLPGQGGSRALAVGDFDRTFGLEIAVARGDGTVTIMRRTHKPHVTASPDALTFPTTQPGQLSDSRAVTVTNDGEAPLHVSSVTIGGLDAEAFRIRGEDCTDTTVEVGGTCTVLVRFAPVALGAASAQVRIHSDDPGTPARVALSGTGGTPPPPAAPAFSASPTSLTFASQKRGTASGSKVVTVRNSGTAPLAISAVGLAGANPGDFAVTADGCTGKTLAPGATCPVSTAFRPTAAGSRSATLRFTDSAAGSPHGVALAGRGCNLLLGSVCL